MNTRKLPSEYLWGCCLAVLSPTACYEGLDPQAAALGHDDTPAVDVELVTRVVRDDVVGVSLAMPTAWATLPDPVRFESGYGFMVFGPDGDPKDTHAHDRNAIARVQLRLDAVAADFDDAVQAKLDDYEEFATDLVEVDVGDGRTGLAITGLPGVTSYSVVFVEADDRLYEIGMWSEEPGLDERGLQILENLAFHPPTSSVDALGLVDASTALYAPLPAELRQRSEAQSAQRRAQLETAVASGQGMSPSGMPDALKDHDRPTGSCSFGQPDWLMWQLQWDNTNAFYYGDWYYLQDEPGWSAMSGNYGSWWGTNFHIYKCYQDRLNQWYANDWPAYYYDNVYSAFEGWVEWAGWGTDGFASLGRYVVVNNGYDYRSLSAHLTSIPNYIYWGAYVDLATVIGHAGDTGEYYAYDDWAPHIHARVGWGEYLTYNGQPYGGESVWPNWLRCWTCYDPDYAESIGGWYSEFFYGRWMRH
jgi:murein DD-endopeptidase MepM/ murein hydrolase activator NlpD